MAKKKKQQSTKRPPVITVLGHVDHGKTTLLDTIRKAKVADGEAGGITQHIGAYQVQLDPKEESTQITFIDTPGHEAFSKMRSRGAQVADIAILIVAANDGVKPQTKEAIQHIKNANIPFIVAINKIDLEGVNLDVVKSQLAEQDVIVEDYGGDVVAIPISAKNNKNIDQLLEMISLIYEMQEVSKPKDNLQAVVMESYVDSQKGTVANILIRNGTIKVSDIVYCDGKSAKVKSLSTDSGLEISKAVISQPVQMLGFKEVLTVGSVITDTDDPFIPEEIKEVDSELDDSEKLKIIIKADVAGTLEAIKGNLTDEILLIDQGIGDISESDVLLAQSTGARLIGFHVSVPRSVKKLADMEKIKIETFDVIYHLLEDLQKRVLMMLEPTLNEEVLGTAEVIAEFKIKGSHIAGCKVTDGKIIRSAKVKVQREDKTIAEPRIGAMQVERTDTHEAKKKQEVALVFRPDVKFEIGDTIISYNIVE